MKHNAEVRKYFPRRAPLLRARAKRGRITNILAASSAIMSLEVKAAEYRPTPRLAAAEARSEMSPLQRVAR